MRLVKVVGQVTATRKDPKLVGARLLLVQPVDDAQRPCGRIAVAVDGLSSREGELVYVVQAREAAYALPGRQIPTDCAIVGKVDAVGS